MTEIDRLIRLFNATFADFNTELELGDSEPVYLPQSEMYPKNRVIFANGFFSSALHEVAHWCIAGVERLNLEDFGYWYKPDGRSASEQAEFERVEVKPQALEWIFSVAAGHPFYISADNLSGGSNDGSAGFKQAVCDQVEDYLSNGLPNRAERVKQMLLDEYGRSHHFTKYRFSVNRLK